MQLQVNHDYVMSYSQLKYYIKHIHSIRRNYSGGKLFKLTSFLWRKVNLSHCSSGTGTVYGN